MNVKVPGPCYLYKNGVRPDGPHRWSGQKFQRTPRGMVDAYWYNHFDRAEKLAFSLIKRNHYWREPFSWRAYALVRSPQYWSWRHAPHRTKKPSPNYREVPLVARGGCNLCGGAIYHLGWHNPWGKYQEPKAGISWHSACAVVYSRYSNPSAPEGMEADHIIPLYRAFRELKDDGLWPHILYFWSPKNIQYLTPEEHRIKSGSEARERAQWRKSQ